MKGSLTRLPVIELEGLVVYIPDTKKAYVPLVPLQAIQLVAGQQVSLPAIAK
jgi:hypothetical protein